MTRTNSSAGGGGGGGGDSTVDKTTTTDTSANDTNSGAGNSSSGIGSNSNSSSSGSLSGSTGVSNESIAGNNVTNVANNNNNKDSNNRINLKQAKISDCDHQALDKNMAFETNQAATATSTNLSKELNSYATVGMHENFQDILETDLSCAICQDIYINPLILNCSHSFCKFCVFRWLSTKTVCPQCRMTVQFQAENLALRNIINRMVLKASPQFQAHRINCVNQRLKDEETQEKDGTNRAVLKNSSSRVGRSNRERLERNRNPAFIFRVFPSPAPPNLDGFDPEGVSSGSDSSDDSSEGLSLFMDTLPHPAGPNIIGGSDDDSNENSNNDENDVTFEVSSNETSSSDDDEDEEMGSIFDDEDSDEEEVDRFDRGWIERHPESDEDLDFDFNDALYESNADDDDDDEEEDEESVDADEEDNVNVVDDDESVESDSDSDDSVHILSSSSSSGDDDVTDEASSPDVFNYALPDTDSDPGTASDDSTEEYSIASDNSGRYSMESTIEFGTTDDDE